MFNSSGNVSNYTAIKWRRKLKIIKAFQSATSIDKMVKSFKEMEKVFDESNLAYGSWKIAFKLMDQGQSPEQVISFASRALQILCDNGINNIPCFGDEFIGPPISIGKAGTLCSVYHKSSLYIAYICILLASACLKLKRVKETLSYLNWSNDNLTKLMEDGDNSCAGYCLLNTLVGNQGELFNLKLYTCRFEEAVIPLRKKLVILETMMEEGCLEIGKTNEQLCATHMMILKYKEALPFCLKSLEIYKKKLGPNSVEVAKTMRRLALIYNAFKEHEKALEQNQLSLDILRNTAPNSSDFLKGEGDTGCILVGLSRYKEAIDVLERVVLRTEMEDKTRFLAYVNMAIAFYYLGKRSEAKKHMRTAQNLFEKKKISHRSAAIAFMDMSVLYENMNDFGRATSLLMRALSMLFIHQKFLLEGSARLFSLISISGKEKEGIAYMEDMVEILKNSFGPEHCEVGYAYKNMAATYLKSGQEELAVKFLVKAKDILDVTLGSHHLDALKTSQALAETYATLRRYDPASEMQQQQGVLKGLKGLGPSEQENLDEAVNLLEKMKMAICADGEKIAIGADTEDFPVNTSKCGISEDA